MAQRKKPAKKRPAQKRRPAQQTQIEAQTKTQTKERKPRKKHKKRRKGRFGFLYKFFCMILICVAIVGGCIVFFKAEHVEISGEQRYTAEEIKEASEIREGENLFLINKFSAISRMMQKLPYLDEVVIRRKLPDTLSIRVTECVPVAAIDWESGYWIIDKKGKLLEEQGDTQGCPVLTGLELLSPVQGSKITLAKDNPRRDYYTTLLAGLEERDLVSHLKSIDLTDPEVTELNYEDRFTIRLAANCEYAYKLDFLLKMLEQLRSNENGILDLTGEQMRFIPA